MFALNLMRRVVIGYDVLNRPCSYLGGVKLAIKFSMPVIIIAARQ